jgi:Toastrack DUF4097
MTGPTDLVRSTREIELGQHGALEIMLPANGIRLRGVDGDRLVIRVPSDRDIDDVLVIDETPGRVRVRAQERGYRLGPIRMWSSHPAPVEIDLPRLASVDLQTMSGDVVASGVDGQTRWSTASGDLRLELGGDGAKAQSMSGDVIVLAARPIAVSIHAVSGDVRVGAPRVESLSVSTTSGDIAVETELDPGGAHRLSSVSGSVELATPSPVRVDVATLTGDLRASGVDRSDGTRGSRTLVAGDGSVPVAIRTTSGDIRVRVGAIGDTTRRLAGATGSDAGAGVVAGPDRAEPDRDIARLEILRSLERGEIGVDAATRQLEAIDAGSRTDG